MAARRTRERLYSAADLRSLLEAGGRNWNDVLQHLRAGKFARASGKARAQLADDLQHLEESDTPFTDDHRKLWKELTGADAPEAVTERNRKGANPANLEDRIPGDVESFDQEEVIHDAENRQASSRVLDVLRRVESKEYKEMAELIESTGDAGWDRVR